MPDGNKVPLVLKCCTGIFVHQQSYVLILIVFPVFYSYLLFYRLKLLTLE
jgi:hypothetical protein